MTWRWLSKRPLLAIHAEQLAEHGGARGIHDGGRSNPALGRPRQRTSCADRDAADLAAAYGYGIVSNHLFVGGNKRTGFVAAATFSS
jgi:death-on-curing protein